MTKDGERAALVAFLAQAVLAGGNAVGIRFSNRENEPLWGAGLRFAGSALYRLFNFGLSFALIYYGLVRVQAGLAQTLLALVPSCSSHGSTTNL